MKAVQISYCTVNFLDEVFKMRKTSSGYKIASRIIENLSNVYLDISSENLQLKIKNDPNYNRLFKRENKSLKCMVNWKERTSFNNTADEVFFIDSNYLPDYKKIVDSKGCLIISSDDIFLINRMNDKRGYICIVPPRERIQSLEDGYQNSWKEAIKTCEIKPINSLIISDNYIFKEIDSKKNSGLFSLLKEIVPDKLTIPFHLAIFSHICDNTFTREHAESLISEIKQLFPTQEILVTIIVHNKKSTTHDRVILSNYHRLTSGVGFSVIKDEDGISEIAEGHIEPVFHAILTTQDNQMCTKHFHYQSIEWLKILYHQKSGTSSSSFVIGDKIHRMLDR